MLVDSQEPQEPVSSPITTDRPLVDAQEDLLAVVRSTIESELDKVIPHVVSALKADQATRAMAQRLESAEKRLADRGNRPIISKLVMVLEKVRRLEFDEAAKSLIVADLEDALVGAGYTEFGEVGDVFDPERHEVLDGSVSMGEAVVLDVLEPGLEVLGDVVVRARVKVGEPVIRSEPIAGSDN